jgi:hypothetical protein
MKGGREMSNEKVEKPEEKLIVVSYHFALTLDLLPEGETVFIAEDKDGMRYCVKKSKGNLDVYLIKYAPEEE